MWSTNAKKQIHANIIQDMQMIMGKWLWCYRGSINWYKCYKLAESIRSAIIYKEIHLPNQVFSLRN